MRGVVGGCEGVDKKRKAFERIGAQLEKTGKSGWHRFQIMFVFFPIPGKPKVMHFTQGQANNTAYNTINTGTVCLY
jgi:hypothetical protein